MVKLRQGVQLETRDWWHCSKSIAVALSRRLGRAVPSCRGDFIYRGDSPPADTNNLVKIEEIAYEVRVKSTDRPERWSVMRPYTFGHIAPNTPAVIPT